MFLKYLISSKKEIVNIFREEELLRKDKNYINKENKKKLFLKLVKLFSILRKKYIIFIIIELILVLFFFYFTTAFCEVYKSTQISWALDCIVSFIMSIIIGIIFSIIIAIIYKFSTNKKLKCLYNIALLLI